MGIFCVCDNCKAMYAGFFDSFGYWDVCNGCHKRIEDGRHYYDSEILCR